MVEMGILKNFQLFCKIGKTSLLNETVAGGGISS